MPDPTFDAGEACDKVFGLLMESDGKIVVAGYRFLRRLNWDGMMDYRFSEPGFTRSQFAEVKTVIAGLEGYVIGGDFTKVRTGSNLYGVAWGQGQFVAVGLNGSILTSPDGAAWAPAASGLEYDIEVSDDLKTWVPAAARGEVIGTIPDIGNSTETVRIRLTPSIQELHRAFLRVVVTTSD